MLPNSTMTSKYKLWFIKNGQFSYPGKLGNLENFPGNY